MKIEIGELAPAFCLPSTTNKEICLKDLKGQWVIIYFYPKDNTKGCTLEAIDFSTKLEEFKALGALVIGISPDSLSSHEKFIKKNDLKVLLLADENKKVLERYGVWQKKSLYGRTYFGVVRSTVIINPRGLIVALWEKVRVRDHVQIVLQRLKELQTTTKS